MNLKQYKIYRILIIVLLSMSISISITLDNYYLPIIFVISAWGAMYYCRHQLKTEEVMADERDYQIAGDAARYTLFIYGLVGSIGTFILMAISNGNEVIYAISQYLAFSVCALLLVNAFIFKYLIRKNNVKK